MAVLSRLTFLAYLLHPALMYLVYLDQPYPQHFSSIWYAFSFCGMLFVVFAFSAIVFVLVEKPLASVEGILLIGKQKEL